MTIGSAGTVSPLDPFEQGDLFDPASVDWIMHLSDLHRLTAAIREASEVVIDLETTGLNEHASGHSPDWPESARVSMAALTLPRASEPFHPTPPTFLVPLSHPDAPLRGHWREVLRTIAKTIREADVPVTNQNLKFDMKWIHATTGVDLSSRFVWDTQIASHLLNENSSTSLKDRAPAMFGVDRWDDFSLATPAASEKVPLFDLGLYAARDTYWTWRLAVAQRTRMAVGLEGEDSPPPETPEEIEEVRLGQLAVWCAMPTSATLTAMEQRGMLLDREWAQEERQSLLAAAQEQFEVLVHRYPAIASDRREPSLAPTSLWFMDWAAAAVEAGDLTIASLTPNGRPQWSKAVLVRQARAGSEVAQRLLDYRDADKRAQFLTGWLSLDQGERIHSTYHAGRVVTGRLSSSDPNMQQVTRSLKPAFVPSPGYLLAELDHSQIELRAAAFIARCEPMLQAFRDGEDLHSLIAQRITGREQVTKEERQGGKAANFGFLYGQESAGFREYAETNYGVTFTPDEAVAVRQAFFDRWDGMAQWHARVAAQARRTGQVVSPLGRVRRVPDIWSTIAYEQGAAERKAINSPVQGFASDLMQLGAASIEGTLPGSFPVPEVRVVATVHDSVVIEVPEDNWQQATGRCMRRMLDVTQVIARMGCILDVPLAVEATVGTRWGLGDVGTIH